MKRADKSHVSHERWLVSYADFITLMFAFFVVLYASSKADQKKQAMVSQAIDSAFHTLGLFPKMESRMSNLKRVSVESPEAATPDVPVTPLNIVMGEQVWQPGKVREDLGKIQKRLEKLLSNQIAEHTVSVQMGREGLVISLREAGFFSSGSATPHAATQPVLEEIGVLLGQTPYNLRIEGHTDNVPIHNVEFDSNWELSAARATRVARIFLGTKGVQPERLSASGYAEFHPAASNDTEGGRAANRRVDVVVVPRSGVDLSSAAPQSDKSTWHRIDEP
jgi:chemotaxis protein MotB